MIVQCRATTPPWRWPKAWPASVDTFVAMMNRQAQAWGLKNTQFKNVTGLSEAGHDSTRARHRGDRRPHHPRASREYYPLLLDPAVHLQQHQAGQPQPAAAAATRRVDGMKTGYTEAAGYCLVASAQRDFPERQAAPAQRGARHRVARGARQREPEAAELGLHRLGRRAAVRSRQAASPVPECGRARSDEAPLGAAGAVARGGAARRGRQAADR